MATFLRNLRLWFVRWYSSKCAVQCSVLYFSTWLLFYEVLNCPYKWQAVLAKYTKYYCYLLCLNENSYDQRVIRRESKTDSYSKGPTLFGLCCILCHNFWTNYDLDLLSTSKWPSEVQFCDKYKGMYVSKKWLEFVVKWSVKRRTFYFVLCIEFSFRL